MKIVVTKDHWEKAKAACTLPLADGADWCRECVLGRAIVDAGVEHTGVGYFRVTFGDGRFVELPEVARDVRREFDRMMRTINFPGEPLNRPFSEPAFPVEFEIEPPL